MSAVNHQFRLAARPVGLPKRDDWSQHREPVGETGDGELLVKVLLHLARPGDARLDERGPLLYSAGGHRRGDAGRRRWAGSSRRTPASRSATTCTAASGCRNMSSSGKGVTRWTQQAPLPVFLGTLGMPGMTAYFGLLDIGKPQAGETGRRSPARRVRWARWWADREDQGLPRGRHRRRRREVPYLVPSLASMPRSTTKARTCKALRKQCPKGSTSISTTSAATSSTRRSPIWRAMPASSSAARSRSTTTRTESRGRSTTFRCSSIAPA